MRTPRNPSWRQAGLAWLATMLWPIVGCAAGPVPAQAAVGEPFPSGEALFRSEPRWLGGDAAYSVPLGPNRTLWLFGDSFVSHAALPSRRASRMVSNSLALQTGMHPERATMEFHWGRDAEGAPAAFFADDAEGIRHWPGHGLRLPDGPLVLFLTRVANTPGIGLGFTYVGYAVAFIDDPDAPMSRWKPRLLPGPMPRFDAMPGAALVRQAEHVVVLAIRQQDTHAGALARYAIADWQAGRIGTAEWWAGEALGWLPEPGLPEAGPAWVMDDAGAESSLHWDARRAEYVHVASYGFGASSIGVRTAPALTGPWSEPVMVYRPPESDSDRPFVYAAKAHPELRAENARDLLITYATNSFDFAELFGDEGARHLYWPRMVHLRRGDAAD